MTFQEILDKYNAAQDLDPTKVAQIYEFKSRIQEALRIGTPIEQVIKSVFSDEETQNDILEGINQYKQNRAKPAAEYTYDAK